jgi:hypothetical protein
LIEKIHALHYIISLVVVGIICGADCFTFSLCSGLGTQLKSLKKQKRILATFLLLPNGIHSHDTINRVFSSIEPKKFELAFMSGVNSLKTKKFQAK